MNTSITAKDFSLTPSLRTTIEEHAEHLLKYQSNIIGVTVALGVDRHHVKGQKFTAEAIVKIPGNDITAHSRAEDMHQALDELFSKLVTQLRKKKERREDRRRPV